MDGLKEWKEEWDALGYTDTQLLDKAELEEKLGTQGLPWGAARRRCGAFPPAELLPGPCARR